MLIQLLEYLDTLLIKIESPQSLRVQSTNEFCLLVELLRWSVRICPGLSMAAVRGGNNSAKQGVLHAR